MNIIIILGPPGVGKGTQAVRLVQMGWIHISTGDILRESIEKGDTLGNKVAQYVHRGELVPNHLIVEVLKQKLQEVDRNSNIVLDGFPRNVEQAKALEGLIKVDKVLYLKCNDEQIIKRLTARRICPQCGEVYNIITKPPSDNMRCDKCGSSLTQREDDREDVIRKRLDVYYRETVPLVEYYRRNGLLEEIDATGTIDEVFAQIREKIEEWAKRK
ncbi:adenylate kinase [candidate division bacterium WOR-3 4484_18]|uniref:Adenylate kinase n=1 Tax=candidate division WOR-3 bacterium 4484_18 TaxID=2020626 RepID=A0A257LV82_UNCW3|nr:MAG: adenylate kinase [candidate division bacterium WOR-3 4484_18]